MHMVCNMVLYLSIIHVIIESLVIQFLSHSVIIDIFTVEIDNNISHGSRKQILSGGAPGLEFNKPLS